MEQSEYVRRGYLNEDFRLFHLKDKLGDENEYHYHEFDKLVIFVSGKVNYMIEGITYPLQPWDILLISNHTIHKAVIDTGEEYERYIIYISPHFTDENNTENTQLMKCFKTAEERRFYLLRPGLERQETIRRIVRNLEDETVSGDYGSDVGAKVTMLQLLIQLNRSVLLEETKEAEPSVIYDPKIASVISYINDNLTGDLSVESLAARSYVSKFHFMRRFKELTGYTVHNYVLQKRLINAAELIKGGAPAAKASVQSGFKDYSTFQRAFKKMFGVNPIKMK